uniref:Uncharacterized protein n=1 Tax=Pygocentrus nattereri TaxID=42514 RepID=A0A3B4EKV6_PYGNA
MNVTVDSLALAVQRLFENELGEAVAVTLRLDVQGKVLVAGDGVAAQGVGAHVRVGGALQGEAGARRGAFRDLHHDVGGGEDGSVVVHVQHLHLHAEQLQWVLQEHLQVQQARLLLLRALAADLLAVGARAHSQCAVLHVHLQVGRARAGHRLEAARVQLRHVQPQVLGDVGHQRAALLLLRNRVTKLREPSMREREHEH